MKRRESEQESKTREMEERIRRETTARQKEQDRVKELEKETQSMKAETDRLKKDNQQNQAKQKKVDEERKKADDRRKEEEEAQRKSLNDLQKQLDEMNNRLSALLSENDNNQRQKVRAQKDLETLKEEMRKEREAHANELLRKNEEVDRLSKTVSTLTQNADEAPNTANPLVTPRRSVAISPIPLFPRNSSTSSISSGLEPF
ncbi:hypothetical protein BLNAU_22298 [Blattamonas nauphoetae]|uniref:Uncharacterized protein n=1 Tax=Blattamonas nauphoetae TaxID=2049346 RepID=A0ABQ9WTG2_9EUKA|nr:hypothetical protein BLNAU_22298 [Blattamonas nauphoetae]